MLVTVVHLLTLNDQSQQRLHQASKRSGERPTNHAMAFILPHTPGV